jgi:hypothetical protein
VLSSSRSQALADTLDWLEERCRSGPLRVRIRTHEGATLEGLLSSVTRRQLQVSVDGGAPPITLAAAEIAKVWVPAREPRAFWRRRWRVWFDYGSS